MRIRFMDPEQFFEPHIFVRIMLTLLRVRCCPRRLAPFGMGPDGDIKIQNTIRIMLTQVTGAGKRVLLLDPEQLFGTTYIDQK